MQAPQYVLSKVGVSTNSTELKLNQQRLLQQNSPKYTPRLPQKPYPQPHNAIFKNQLSDLNPFKSDDPQYHYNSYLTKSSSQPQIHKNIHAQTIKNSLSNELGQQIALKQQLQKYGKKQELTMEQKIVMHNKLLENKEALKQKNFKEIFKQQAIRNTEMKQLRKKNEKQYEKLEKRSFDRLYRKNHEILQKRILGIDDMQSSIPIYKRFSQSQLANYIFNPEVGILPKISIHKPNWEQSSKLKENLKQTLIEQMKINSERKRVEREKQLNTPFIDEKFKNFDNPITNPIDIKIAKDNKYLMKQLLGSKMTMGKGTMGFANDRQSNMRGSEFGLDQASYLSRRGSISLSRLGFGM